MTNQIVVSNNIITEALIAYGNNRPTKKHIAIMHALMAFIESPEGMYSSRLSQREKTCLIWIIQGKGLLEIGELMSIKRSTVASYIKRLKTKLKSKTLAQTVFMAIRYKEIDMEKLNLIKREL